MCDLIVVTFSTTSHKSTSQTPDSRRRADYLVQTWQSMYALDPATSIPPPHITRPSLLASEQPLGAPPWAPHLEDCSARGRRDKASDTWPPHWVQQNSAPDPPWVSGDDSENLSLTRKTQADIWVRHHPQDCSDPSHKFLVTSWIGRFGRDRSIPGLGHGLGSELHVMSSFLSLALAHNRILVIRPHTFGRANHSGCSGSASSNLHCYFAAPSSASCVLHALSHLASKGGGQPNQGLSHLNSSLRAVEIEPHQSRELEAGAAL